MYLVVLIFVLTLFFAGFENRPQTLSTDRKISYHKNPKEKVEIFDGE